MAGKREDQNIRKQRLKVRPATAADIFAMLDLERQCLTAAHWSQQQYEHLFRSGADGPHRLVLAIDEPAGASPNDPKSADSSLHGFLIARQIGPEWELENIAVAPNFRRKGLATQLFTALLAKAREANSELVFLEVRASNHAARAAYTSLGFREVGCRTSYYANPQEDAVLYRLVLNPLQN